MLTVVVLGSTVMLGRLVPTRLRKARNVSVPSGRMSSVIEMFIKAFVLLWPSSNIMLVISLKSSGAAMRIDNQAL